jgi:A/G-specific adenine glycosylase
MKHIDRSPSYLARLSPAARLSLVRRLLVWFRKTRRDLPWRQTTDPYRIWVSEVMLQQTQIATVIPYYERFLARFPTVEALAKASDQAVLKVWQGLGYYRRAMNLHAAARVVVRDHGGRVPDDPEAFTALPGVGRYTAGAVLSIAFGRRMPCVDGNAVRVFARWFAIAEPATQPKVARRLWVVAEALVPEGDGARRASSPAKCVEGKSIFGRPACGPIAFTFGTGKNAPGDWNQAIMELGARVCTPRAPRCPDCPVRRECLARRRGLQDRLPIRRKRKAVPHIEVGAGIIWRRGRVLLCKRRADAMLGGLWEFPGGKLKPGESIQECIRRELREECDLPVTVGEHLIDVTHAYSHLRVALHLFHCRAGPGRVKLLGCDAARWVQPDEITDYPLPAADVKILEALARYCSLKSSAE